MGRTTSQKPHPTACRNLHIRRRVFQVRTSHLAYAPYLFNDLNSQVWSLLVVPLSSEREALLTDGEWKHVYGTIYFVSLFKDALAQRLVGLRTV